MGIFNVTGPGVDGEIGREILDMPNTRFYVGGYYFAPKAVKSIEGVSVRLNVPFNHYVAFTAGDSYDNTFHNSVEAGVKLTLGGIDDDVAKNNRDIHRRMMDPIPRNLVTLSRGNAEPIQRVNEDQGQLVLERDNIYFFTTTDGSAFNAANRVNNCTFEHPCRESDFSQTTINSLSVIAPNTNFYLSPGLYDFSGTAAGLTINNSQSIFGRTANYVQPASGNDRPLLNGGSAFSVLSLLGNNTLDSLRVTGAGAVAGVTISNATNVLISNSQIGDPATPNDFFAALDLVGNSRATVINSSLSANFALAGVETIVAQDNSILTLENSTVLAANTTDAGPTIGLVTLNAGRINVSNSNVSAINTLSGIAVGAQSNGTSQIFISGSTISAIAATADVLQQNAASTITVVGSHCFQNGAEVACTP